MVVHSVGHATLAPLVEDNPHVIAALLPKSASESESESCTECDKPSIQLCQIYESIFLMLLRAIEVPASGIEFVKSPYDFHRSLPAEV